MILHSGHFSKTQDYGKELLQTQTLQHNRKVYLPYVPSSSLAAEMDAQGNYWTAHLV
jgi:hypothetical protein